MNKTIITASNVSRLYRSGAKEVRALDSVTCQIKKGGSLAIAGPSGAGKSTLMHLLGGLDAPTSGAIIFEGTDLYKLPDKERARIRNRRIGFIFQSYYLLPELNALENVMLPAMISGRYSESRAREILRLVGLEKRASHKPSELSGGESQRVAIARSLINEPEVLLCDEPTGNLDSASSDSIFNLLFEIRSRCHTALVIVTHNEAIAGLADSVLRLKDGKAA